MTIFRPYLLAGPETIFVIFLLVLPCRGHEQPNLGIFVWLFCGAPRVAFAQCNKGRTIILPPELIFLPEGLFQAPFSEPYMLGYIAPHMAPKVVPEIIILSEELLILAEGLLCDLWYFWDCLGGIFHFAVPSGPGLL